MVYVFAFCVAVAGVVSAFATEKSYRKCYA
jgi:hypothetical protein